MATPVTVPPALMVTLPSALDVVPTPIVEPKLTVAVVYPTPPSEIVTEEIVPNPETTAVPAAPVLVSCLINLIFFWKIRDVSFSFCELKIGLRLST